MANVKELRGRIKSVGNIKQITRAMEMVATTKLRRFQDRAVGSGLDGRGESGDATAYYQVVVLVDHSDKSSKALPHYSFQCQGSAIEIHKPGKPSMGRGGRVNLSDVVITCTQWYHSGLP